METVKTIFEKAYAHQSLDKNGHSLGFVYWYPEKIITKEEKEEAKQKLEELKKQKKSEYKKGEEFRLCAMWSERNDIDFNNYRARAEFLAPDWKKWFVEFTTREPRGAKQVELHLDFLINRTLEEEYNNKLAELMEKNQNTPFYNWTEEEKSDWEKYHKQPYYWEKTHEAEDFLKGKPATRETALAMINHFFGTNFKTLEIVDYLLPSDWLNF